MKAVQIRDQIQVSLFITKVFHALDNDMSKPLATLGIEFF